MPINPYQSPEFAGTAVAEPAEPGDCARDPRDELSETLLTAAPLYFLLNLLAILFSGNIESTLYLLCWSTFVVPPVCMMALLVVQSCFQPFRWGAVGVVVTFLAGMGLLNFGLFATCCAHVAGC